MDDDQRITTLSQIDTSWSLIALAHQNDGDATTSARCELMVRYAGAVQRFLLRATHDPDLAAELGQEFALRFLRGDFSRVDPERGRFRSYVKSALHNLMVDFHRRRKHQPLPLTADVQDVVDLSQQDFDLDRPFLDCWRDEILSRAWERLAVHEERTGQPFYTVLRLRADNPSMRSHEMSERLTSGLGKPVNAGWVRQNLLRARDRFAEFVEAEVAHSLGNPPAEERDEEIRNLGLWEFCSKKEARRRPRP
jgi:DNA-directed RNA polymerase specialized sigma24 family protein